jgi:hypothetical protein
MKAACSSETSVDFQRTTEDRTLNLPISFGVFETTALNKQSANVGSKRENLLFESSGTKKTTTAC